VPPSRFTQPGAWISPAAGVGGASGCPTRKSGPSSRKRRRGWEAEGETRREKARVVKEGGGRGLQSGKRRLVASSRQSAPDSRSVHTYVTRVSGGCCACAPFSPRSRFPLRLAFLFCFGCVCATYPIHLTIGRGFSLWPLSAAGQRRQRR